MKITLNEMETKLMLKALVLAIKETKKQMQTGYLNKEEGRIRLKVYTNLKTQLQNEGDK